MKYDNLFDLTRETKEVNEYQGTKETARLVKKHLSERFPLFKFSVYRPYYSSINVKIISGPFPADSDIVKAIVSYAKSYISSFERCTNNDPYGDYGSSYNFYFDVYLYDYQQKEVEGLEPVSNKFDEDKKAFEKAEEERREKEFQEYRIRQREEEKKQKEQQEIFKAKQAEELNVINADLIINEVKEYKIQNVKFPHLNKNNTLEEYKKELNTGGYNTSNVRVTKELHFYDHIAFDYFCNSLLTSFEFLSGEGGSITDDERIQTIEDYSKLPPEDAKTVIWDNIGLAVFFNGKYQFVVNPEGYSYARYVGLGGNLPGEAKKISLPEMNFTICLN